MDVVTKSLNNPTSPGKPECPECNMVTNEVFIHFAAGKQRLGHQCSGCNTLYTTQLF